LNQPGWLLSSLTGLDVSQSGRGSSQIADMLSSASQALVRPETACENGPSFARWPAALVHSRRTRAYRPRPLSG